MNKQGLARTQEWMKTVLVARGNLPQKLQTAETQTGLSINEVVANKRGLSALRRLDIYAAGYVLRLLECLQADFPGLRTFVGEQLFEVFAKAYIVTQPPQSWSLYHLGRDFPQFLRDTRPKSVFSPEAEVSAPEHKAMLELPAEIAAFERAKMEVQFAEGNENNPVYRGQTDTIPLGFLQTTLPIKTPPCLRLIKLQYPVRDFLAKLEAGGHTQLPHTKTTYLAITRLNFRLHIVDLEPWHYAFLAACHNPTTVYLAAVKAAEETQIDLKTVFARLLVWFPIAFEMGCLLQAKQD